MRTEIDCIGYRTLSKVNSDAPMAEIHAPTAEIESCSYCFVRLHKEHIAHDMIPSRYIMQWMKSITIELNTHNAELVGVSKRSRYGLVIKTAGCSTLAETASTAFSSRDSRGLNLGSASASVTETAGALTWYDRC